MGNTIKASLIIVLAFAFGALGGRYLSPPKIEEKIVEKVVEKEKKDIHTVTRIIERKDGTKETTIEQTDKSTSSTSKDKSSESKMGLPDWKATVSVGYDLKNNQQYYMGTIDRRILGGISLSVFGTSRREVGVGVGVEF